MSMSSMVVIMPRPPHCRASAACYLPMQFKLMRTSGFRRLLQGGGVMSAFAGGCACGRIRYECSEQPIVQLICHCRDCQRASGSAFAAVIAVPSDRLKFSGSKLKYHSLKADSGRTMRRGFCSECGSPISIRRPETPLIEFLQAASLDDPSKFHPTCEVWVSSADPWHPIHSATRKFDQNPAAEAVRGPIEAYFAARAQTPPQR